jgi:hypothetical protein
VDSGATHDVLSEKFAGKSGLMKHATNTSRTISGFDGTLSRACFQIELLLDHDQILAPFIITALKDAYDVIMDQALCPPD